MLKRKIERELMKWKKTPNHSPLIVKGCRSVEKPIQSVILQRRTINMKAIWIFFKILYMPLFSMVSLKLIIL